MIRKAFVSFTFGALLCFGAPVLAQPTDPVSPADVSVAPEEDLASVDPSAEFFVGKRVWVDWKGSLGPTGVITKVFKNGKYRVEVYEHSQNNDPRVTKAEEAFLRGKPLGSVTVEAADMEKWNKARYTTWVYKDGKPWPKAEVIEDTGKSVKVRIFDTDGTAVAEEKVISDPAELAKYRALNVATKPAAGTTSWHIDEATRDAVAKMNAELAAKDNKLPSGEVFPSIATVPQVVRAIRTIAYKYVDQIRSETNPFVRSELQDKMMREIYVAFENMTWIKHGGRDTTTAEWKAEGARLVGLLPKEANALQREIISRTNSCYGKSEIVWKFLNLARIPELTGVGVRRLDGGFHGILYVEYDDHSRRTWETTEGFEPHGTRAFKRWEVMFSGKGDKGTGLAYFDRLTPTADAPAHQKDNVLAKRVADSYRNRAAASPESSGLTSVLKDRIAEGTHPTDAKDR